MHTNPIDTDPIELKAFTDYHREFHKLHIAYYRKDANGFFAQMEVVEQKSEILTSEDYLLLSAREIRFMARLKV